jgi:hypothetical protein
MQYDLNDSRIVREVYIEADDSGTNYRTPGIAYDPVEQRLWCLYTAGATGNLSNPNGGRYLYASYSNDDGATWSTRELIEDVGGGRLWNTVYGTRQGVSVEFGWDGSAIAAMYYDDGGGNEYVYAWHYTPSARWGTKQTVSTSGGAGGTAGYAASVAVGPSGEGVCILNNPNASNLPRAFIHTYDPTTTTWSGGQKMQVHTSNHMRFCKALFNTPRNEFDVVWWLYGVTGGVHHAIVTRDFVIGPPEAMGFAGAGDETDGSNDVIADPIGDLHFMHSAGAGVYTHKYWERTSGGRITTNSLDYRANGTEKIQSGYNTNLISWGDGIYAFYYRRNGRS